MSSGEEFPLYSYVTYTCDLSHQKNDVLTLSVTPLNLCIRGGMNSYKLSKGKNASKRLGTAGLHVIFTMTFPINVKRKTSAVIFRGILESHLYCKFATLGGK